MVLSSSTNTSYSTLSLISARKRPLDLVSIRNRFRGIGSELVLRVYIISRLLLAFHHIQSFLPLNVPIWKSLLHNYLQGARFHGFLDDSKSVLQAGGQRFDAGHVHQPFFLDSGKTHIFAFRSGRGLFYVDRKGVSSVFNRRAYRLERGGDWASGGAKGE
jgi:hypothetical protein